MHYCSMCNTSMKVDRRNYPIEKHCNFCGSSLYNELTGFPIVVLEGARYQRRELKQSVNLNDAECPVSVLDTFHTYDLYLLLRLVRNQRHVLYKQLGEANKIGSAEEKRSSSSLYDYWTRRQNVIENVLIDREGYFPARITDKLLREKLELITKNQQQSMRSAKQAASK